MRDQWSDGEQTHGQRGCVDEGHTASVGASAERPDIAPTMARTNPAASSVVVARKKYPPWPVRRRDHVERTDSSAARYDARVASASVSTTALPSSARSSTVPWNG